MNEAATKLNGRLGALGEREREQADIDRQLVALRSDATASEEELAKVQSQINARLKVLGDREQALAEYDAKARNAAYQLEQLQSEAAKLEPQLASMKSQLGQLDVQAAERKRVVEDSYNKVAKANQALAEIRQLVSQ